MRIENVTFLVTFQVSDPVEEWVPGEFELPEYFHHSINDSQVSNRSTRQSQGRFQSQISLYSGDPLLPYPHQHNMYNEITQITVRNIA